MGPRWLTALLAAAVVAGAAAPAASADRDFAVRYTVDAQGDITGTGNALLTCTASDRCSDAQAGRGGGDNNDLAMRMIDVDGDSSTFNSSRAKLDLPANARVLFAGLYYGGRWQAGTGGSPAPNPSALDKVLLAAPGGTAYRQLTATSVDDANKRVYQGFVDVTDVVAASGAGTYTVANVQLGTGQNADQSGGWALAVAYADPAKPTRNLTIFDGMKFVTAVSEGGRPVDIPLSGFLTPKTGPVRTRVGLIAYEGDLGKTGDSATLNGRVLTDAANPPNNFFNSSIASVGTSFTDREPAYKNQLGFDADFVDATGLLQNSQTSTTLRLATDSDGYAPGGVSFATDLYAPSLTPTKAVDKAVAEIGDELTYTMSVENTGLDAALDTTLVDAIPAGTSFVPGSLTVVAGANPGIKSDAVGDDQGEFDAASGLIRFRLGAGATGADGGRLAVGDATTVSYRVKIESDNGPGAIIINQARIGFTGETLGRPGQVDTPAVDTRLIFPDLAIKKTHTGDFAAGGTTTFHLAVDNVGAAATRGTVTVTDTLRPQFSFAGTPSGAGWSCSTQGRTLTCTRSDVLAPGGSYPVIDFRARIASRTPARRLFNPARVSGGGDVNRRNNLSIDHGKLHLPDLAIEKTADRGFVFAGQRADFTIRVSNIGTARATRVHVADLLPRGMTLLSLSSNRGTCTRLICNLGTMDPGDTATLHLAGLVASSAGRTTLVNRAVVAARESELTLSNNHDSASVRVRVLVDLVVSKVTAAPKLIIAHDAVYVITVTNAGPSDATGVRLADRLPLSLTLKSLTPLQGTCTGLTCTLGDLPAGGSTQLTLVADTSAALVDVPLRNRVAAIANEPELNLANNIAHADITISPQAPGPPDPDPDVTVTKTADVSTVLVGNVVTYTIVASNAGPGDAPNVVVTDTPAGPVEVVSADPSQGTCTTAVPIVCELGPIAAGEHATVTVRMRPLAAGALQNGVTALAPSSGDGAVEAATATNPSARLAVTKRANRTVVHGHDTVTFTVRVRSLGPTTAKDVEVCDDLPSQLTYVSLGGAKLRKGQACWSLGDMPAGTSRTRTLVVRASPVSHTQRVTNQVEATADNARTRDAHANVRILPGTGPGVTG